MSQSLGLSMIVKDAESKLAQCLESVRGVVDEMVIGDTGCADSSPDIARRYGARVIPVPWENDFSRARNQVLAENSTDWILFMDADEMLDEEGRRAIPALLTRDFAGYKVTIWNYVLSLSNRLWDSPAKPNPHRIEAAKSYPAYVEHQNVRLFRRDPAIYFEGRVHETTGHRILNTGRKLGEANFVIHHFGLALDAEARIQKSKFYRELGREKIRENPNDAQAHFELGIEELDTFRDPAAALPCFERVIELTPKSHRAWTFAGVTLVRLEKYQEGLKRLKRAEQLGGRNALVFENQGDAYYHLGDFDDARRCYERAQRQGGTSALLESKTGVCEVRLGRSEQGIRRMEHAIEREPNFAEIYDILTTAAAWLGNPKLAAKTAERRLKAAEPTPEGFLKAASIWAQMGEWQRVTELLREGCERFPEAEKLRLALAEVSNGRRNSFLPPPTPKKTGEEFTGKTAAGGDRASSAAHPLVENGYVRLRQCRHGLFAYNKNDVFIGRSLDLYGEWCESELSLLGQILRSGHVVLDVGAHLGTHTVFFAQSVAPDGMVVALEPQRLTFQLLCTNVALNSLSNVICLQTAGSEVRGAITVPVLNPAVEQNFGAFAIEGHTAAGDSVSAIPLDDLQLARCDLIKVDVEGMEEKVLRGAQQTLQRCRPVLFVEHNTENRSPDLLHLLGSLDYRAFWSIAPYYNPDNFFANPDNCFAGLEPEANLLCLPSGASIDPGPLWPVVGDDDTWLKAIRRHATG